MTLQLKLFYLNLQAWIDERFPPHSVFDCNRPLCPALLKWAVYRELDCFASSNLNDELFNQFVEAYQLKKVSGTLFPFNSLRPGLSAMDDYLLECDLGRVYDNPKRLAWIKEHAEK